MYQRHAISIGYDKNASVPTLAKMPVIVYL